MGGPVMNAVKKCAVGTLGIIFILATFTSISQAETPFDFTSCHSGVVKALYSSEELKIFSAEGWGIIMSNHENKVFHNYTFHVMAIGQVMPGKTIEFGYIKLIDPNGDIIVMEFNHIGLENVSKILYGTGKWKGITGSSKSGGRIVFGRIPPDAAAACSRTTGTFALPK
jgi:hypothetical protein